jgi:Fic family protein
MRLKIKNSVITIPDKLIKQLNELDVETANAINVLINKGERIISQKKQDTARTASRIKQNKTKEKIQNAINLLRLQSKPINPYQVAKLSGVAYNTAKKYVKKLKEKGGK